MICGIDVGLNGAIAFVGKDQVQVFDMPTYQITVGKSKKMQIDLSEFARIIDEKAGSIKHCYIEAVTATPQMGVTSAFSFGKSAGIAEAIIAANFIPFTMVRPQVWKKHFGLTADKDASRQKASRLYPNYAHFWNRKKDDGRAEAVLIAAYGLAQ